MNENENNFESLRRLLVLKRHETPPPGYFNYFSSQVLQRIRAGDPGTSANWAEELFGQAPWLEKLAQVLDVKPVFASAFAGALCLLLFLGIIYAERPDLTLAAGSAGRQHHRRFTRRRVASLVAASGSNGDRVQHQSRAQSSAGRFALWTAKFARPAGQLFTSRQLIRFETRCALETPPRLSLNRAGANQSHRGSQPKRRRGQDHHGRQSCRVPRRAGPARAPV